MINEFQGEYRFLSNFWPAIVTLDNVRYPSVEHAYMAAKTTDQKTRMKIREQPTAAMAKKLGRSIQLRPDWKQIKLGVMESLVRQKFQEIDLKTRLLATNNQEIIEGNTWNDTFWGVCRGKGENHLGKIIMKVRNEIRSEQLNVLAGI
jgi:ribA/ribD-fused uncharacterized protein